MGHSPYPRTAPSSLPLVRGAARVMGNQPAPVGEGSELWHCHEVTSNMLRRPYAYVEAAALPRDASVSRGALSREDQPHAVVLGRQRLVRVRVRVSGFIGVGL